MDDTDRRDTWLMLQLAESGRPVEQIAQFLASMFISADMSRSTMLDEIKMIAERTVELMENERMIWNGLLPGPPGSVVDDYVMMTMEEFGKLERAHRTEALPPDEHFYSFSIWRDNDEILVGQGEEAESVLGLAPTVFGLITDLMAGSDPERWASWITHNKSEQQYLMSYEVASVILRLDEAAQAWDGWTTAEISWDYMFQIIQDDMAVKGMEFARTNG